MSGLELLALLWLFASGFGGSHEPTPEPSGPTPGPSPTPSPSGPVTPTKGPVVAPQAIPAWPVANKPTDLPPFPDGWEPYTPPPPAVVTRANELIGPLWKSGKPGGKTQEQTNGVWVTYVAFTPAKGKKGVAAYRQKPGAASSPVLSSVPTHAIVPAKTVTKPTKKKGRKA